jgi:hypothetical protein
MCSMLWQAPSVHTACYRHGGPVVAVCYTWDVGACVRESVCACKLHTRHPRAEAAVRAHEHVWSKKHLEIRLILYKLFATRQQGEETTNEAQET